MPIYYRNIPLSEPFIFDSIGNHWNQERLTRPKGFPLYHYLQTEKGQGKIIIQGEKYILNEGQGVLIAPFIRHSYSRESEEWLTLFATFTGTLESSISKMLGNRSIIFVEKEQGLRIATMISDTIRKYESSPIDTKSLSIDCYSLLMNFVDGVYTSELSEHPLYRRYIEPTIKEIETNYNCELTTQGLSSRLYITPQYLSRLFNRFLGCSPYEYLTIYRMNKAKEFLLTKPQMKVQEIAGQVGIIDASHFIAMFKKVTGITPLEFRRIN